MCQYLIVLHNLGILNLQTNLLAWFNYCGI